MATRRKSHTPPKKQASHGAHRTRDHEVIRKWAEQRQGRPALVVDTEILRIDFDEPQGSEDESLKAVSWDTFFQVFDDRGLDFLFQDRTEDGQVSRFNKFVTGH